MVIKGVGEVADQLLIKATDRSKPLSGSNIREH